MALECLPRSGRYGFNLLEMLVLLSAIAVAFLAASQVAPIRVKHSAVEATKQEMDALRMALLDYYRDNAAFPEGLARLADNPPPPVATWNGPYIRANSTSDDYAKDGWGSPYRYEYTPGAWGADSAQLYSFGPNRTDETLSGDDIPAQGSDGRIGSEGIRKEIERLVQAELTVIQQAAVRYEAVEGSFPPNINQLYNPINYLYDNSYRDDLWGSFYRDNQLTQRFYSRGPRISETTDDIYPLSAAAGSGATYYVTSAQDGDFGASTFPPTEVENRGTTYCNMLWPGSHMATGPELTACLDAGSCQEGQRYWSRDDYQGPGFQQCAYSGTPMQNFWLWNIPGLEGADFRDHVLDSQTCNLLARVVCVEP